MSRVLLIADDLTGALDSGVAFAAPETRVLVARSLGEVRAVLAEAPDVLVVSSGTRDGTASAATAAMTELCERIDFGAYDVIVKKVDSRLKGHVGAEVSVLADALADLPIVVAPAIPSMGRIQRDGAIRGHGIERPIAVAPLFDRAVQCPELATEADLDRLVAECRPSLWVGARSLAFALARDLRTIPPSRPSLPRPILVAIGSRDPVTQAQVDVLRRSWNVLAAPDGDLAEIAGDGAVVIVQMTEGGTGRSPAEAASAFSTAIAALMRDHAPATLIASGGETANAILDASGLHRLSLIAEIAPGLPVSDVRTDWGELRLVTKSGGFGGPDALADLVHSDVQTSKGPVR
ncbi:uncharacterized protein YgbK (DUF1537 family) [Palleronia aestuarii]|uniref:Uncharacterized protein YgbK (DUF1537 family) n=1 Tax=Palleronia aestuarii TaxID=568105 RepID=A0A2W7NA71_9RHOB|nr:four-carbon acid sugar kinase family protein [Palleronia aestuarii]PZX17141.1 uncharacterized protein YgbK (DUF1537 family) [Palleronia aestuarii]